MLREVGPVEIVVSDHERGERLDRILARRSFGWSRSAIQRWIQEGRVTVDGFPASAKQRPESGSKICVSPGPPAPSSAEPEDLPLAVLHEDEHIVVVDKAAGMVVHPAAGHPTGTLVNALLARVQFQDHGDPMRPGIVHRLDRGTSGVMVVAKTVTAREGLVAAFKAHDIEREYVAIVAGEHPPQATYDASIGRHPKDRKRFTCRAREGRASFGKRAVTHVFAEEQLSASTYVRCRLETGRTHQIRVHLSEHGFPLLGDPVYGRAHAKPELRQVSSALGRQALHARLLAFCHPATGQRVEFSSCPPEDIRSALSALQH